MFSSSLITGAAVLLAFTSSAFAGSATVVNNCGIPIYYASVAAGSWSDMQLLPPGGYSEGYGADGVGVSIKLSTNSTGAVSQFEFTPSGGSVAYDMSNINGYPFAAGGMTLSPSAGASSDYPTCIPVSCTAGVSVCAAAYNQPDDTRTLMCSSSTDLTLTLCTGGSMKRDQMVSHAHRVHARHLPRRQ